MASLLDDNVKIVSSREQHLWQHLDPQDVIYTRIPEVSCSRGVLSLALKERAERGPASGFLDLIGLLQYDHLKLWALALDQAAVLARCESTEGEEGMDKEERLETSRARPSKC